MSLFKGLLGKKRSASAAELQPIRDEVWAAISMCGLAGFSGDKMRAYLETIPRFDAVDCDAFDSDALPRTFTKQASRRDAVHVSTVECAPSAAALRARANDMFARRTGVPDPEGAVARASDDPEETKTWVVRWTEEIRLLSVHSRHQLELKFENELAAAIAAAAAGAAAAAAAARTTAPAGPRPRAAAAAAAAAKGLDADQLKHARNLEQFNRDERARREDLESSRSRPGSGNPTNNRAPITFESLRKNHRITSLEAPPMDPLTSRRTTVHDADGNPIDIAAAAVATGTGKGKGAEPGSSAQQGDGKRRFFMGRSSSDKSRETLA